MVQYRLGELFCGPGGGTHIYHLSELRALTNRERARLQTFKDDYVFSGSKESVRKQIGRRFPVRGCRIIRAEGGAIAQRESA
jgi:site-specific DNA-cytosine methylase